MNPRDLLAMPCLCVFLKTRSMSPEFETCMTFTYLVQLQSQHRPFSPAFWAAPALAAALAEASLTTLSLVVTRRNSLGRKLLYISLCFCSIQMSSQRHCCLQLAQLVRFALRLARFRLTARRSARRRRHRQTSHLFVQTLLQVDGGGGERV